ncbi:uncharacterized protein isoform X5 [Choristoneura fumiferana]|uniref:uncharacterized protein isoform X5 n=1 Tax=Choristoneura fumiferana TaxID=7141 RepID=UPI003D15DF81
MWEYLAVLLIGFWLGIAIFLYVSCYWLEEILDLPPSRTGAPSSASNAHAQLKRLVARVVEEAAALPALARYAAEPAPAPVENNTYEDLLATAILNKVIERYQTEGSGGRSSGIHSASASPSPSDRSSPPSLHSRHRNRDISPPLREEDDVSDWEEGATEDALELPRRAPFPDFNGDLHHTDNDDRDFDEVSGSEIQPIDGTWEENWLFQKKKIKSMQSVPVPMLVPNSNAEFKAMIGDRDADDTTDLSDNASETEEEIDYKSDIKRVLDSKHVIGGAPMIDETLDFEPDSLTIIDGSDDFEKLDEKEYMLNQVVDVVNNEVKGYAANGEKMNGNVVGKADSDDSVLIVGVDSGPLTKAEFALKEEIHRTLLNGNVDSYIEDLKAKENDEVFTNNTNKINIKGTSGPTSTLSRHEREQEYEETVTLPVQRYADSLRRKHFDDEPQQYEKTTLIPTRDTDYEDDLIPGSIAYRERKKWLNYVEMPNNPYSPEAIQKRLSSKSTSSLFDTLTSKSKIDDKPTVDVVDGKEKLKKDEIPVKEEKSRPSLSVSTEDIHMNGSRSKSPSPRILKDVLAEEIPQYKRYGRDYYLKEAKASSGSRKKGYSDTSSVSSINKSTSLDNFDVELTTPVSASSSLSDLEACALHQNIVRAVLSPRNASPNFAINPIFENPDRPNDSADENHAHDTDGPYHVREPSRVCNGEGYENEDIVRLKIPIKPEVTEDLFESYTNVRRSNTLRSEDLCVRSKRRPGLNYTFGGSLRLSKAFHTDLWDYL